VARDRQRAKQRRSRQAGAGGSRSTRPRTGGTPTPDPLKQAFPDVEEAELAEAGAGAADEGAPIDAEELPELEEGFTEEEFEREEDSLERDRDLASASSVRREAERDTVHHRSRGRALTFLGHVIDELRRVQWPDRRQVGQGTLVTLLFVLIAGGYLGLLDAIWKPVIEAIL
jgi:preprotein translocase subunit SecE